MLQATQFEVFIVHCCCFVTIGEGVDQLDKETKDSLSNSFKRELDLNHDGHLDKVCLFRTIFVVSLLGSYLHILERIYPGEGVGGEGERDRGERVAFNRIKYISLPYKFARMCTIF